MQSLRFACALNLLTSLVYSTNIVIMGKAGVGKSTLVNSLYGSEVATVDDDGTGTLETSAYEMTFETSRYTLWDTPGLYDAQVGKSIVSILQEIVQSVESVSVLLIAMDATDSRLANRTENLHFFKLLHAVFGEAVWQRVVIVMTKSQGLSRQEMALGKSSITKLVTELAEISHMPPIVAVGEGIGQSAWKTILFYTIAEIAGERAEVNLSLNLGSVQRQWLGDADNLNETLDSEIGACDAEIAKLEKILSDREQDDEVQRNRLAYLNEQIREMQQKQASLNEGQQADDFPSSAYYQETLKNLDEDLIRLVVEMREQEDLMNRAAEETAEYERLMIRQKRLYQVLLVGGGIAVACMSGKLCEYKLNNVLRAAIARRFG